MEEVHDDDEAVREQEEYIKALVADCPAFSPDPRQACFFGHMDEMRKDPEWKDPEFIQMGGFRASAVDLGYLKDKALKMVGERGKEYGPYGLAHLIDMMLSQCVQRLKAAMIGPDTERGTIEVRFDTKDDEGYYEYRFAVPIPDDVDGEVTTHGTEER